MNRLFKKTFKSSPAASKVVSPSVIVVVHSDLATMQKLQSACPGSQINNGQIKIQLSKQSP